MPGNNLIQRCRNGDREAFNELIRQYQDRVINIAYNMLSDRDDAYDAAQETFIRVYRNIAAFRGDSSFVTWIYRITSNICKDMLRKRMKHPNMISLSPPDDEQDSAFTDVKDDGKTPEEELETTELQKDVRKALALLKTEYREVIVCCDIEQMSYEEAAQIIGCPMGTVKSRLSRARNALKNILLKSGTNY